MKILNREEREAHATHIASEGLKGLFVGGLLSLGAFGYLKLKHPVRFKQFNTSIKACILIMPTVSCCAFYADQGSVQFDKLMRSSPKNEQILMNRFRDWKSKSTPEKIVSSARGNKIKVTVGAWLASVGGYYAYLKQDNRLAEAQRMAKLKTFTLAVSVVLLTTALAALYVDNANRVSAKEPVKQKN